MRNFRTSNGSKIARMAPISTIFSRKRSRRPDLFFRKFLHDQKIFRVDEKIRFNVRFDVDLTVRRQDYRETRLKTRRYVRTFLVFEGGHSLCSKQDIPCVATTRFRVFQAPTMHMPFSGEFNQSSQDLGES